MRQVAELELAALQSELVHHVFNLDPSPSFVRPALESYQDSGGTPGARAAAPAIVGTGAHTLTY